MRRFNTLLIKPASFLCNMRCKYCFYIEETNNREKQYGKLMTLDTAKIIIDKFLLDTSEELNFVFQGGEPLLAGLRFFKDFVAYVKERNTKNIRINYSLQTNGLLVTEEFANFFKQNNFLIGISLDGTKEIHDKNRIDTEGNPTYNRVLKATNILKKAGVDFNILTVVTNEVSSKIVEICKENKDLGFNFVQFISEIEGSQNKDSLSVESFTTYLINCFDVWYNDILNGTRWYHRYFDALLNRIALNSPPECTCSNQCGLMYAFESNGDVYPCDFYMTDDYLLGNIKDNTISELDDKRNDIKFLTKSISQKCKQCKYFSLCMGGCKAEKILDNNKFCSAYLSFFEHALPKYFHLIELIKQHQI